MANFDLSLLTSVYEKRQAYFNTLPYGLLLPTLDELSINLLKVDNKDILYEFLRKSGVLKPYDGSGVPDYSSVGKFKERSLEMKPAYAALKDTVKNLKAKNPLNKDYKNVNQTKRDPYEVEVLEAKIRTFAEDVLDALFFSEFNQSDKSPMGCFDGYNTKLDAEVAAGEIAVANGNLVNSNSLAAPTSTSDTAAFDNFVAWLRSGHPMLRGKQSVLYIPSDTLMNIEDAGFNKFAARASDIDVIARALTMAKVQNCKVLSHYALGSGDRLIWTIPYNLDFGMNNEGDMTFVQINKIFEDPNFYQTWMQAEFGTRIRSTHEKVFQMNTGTNTSVPLSGDYAS